MKRFVLLATFILVISNPYNGIDYSSIAVYYYGVDCWEGCIHVTELESDDSVDDDIVIPEPRPRNFSSFEEDFYIFNNEL